MSIEMTVQPTECISDGPEPQTSKTPDVLLAKVIDGPDEIFHINKSEHINCRESKAEEISIEIPVSDST